MANITAADVNNLRKQTGSGMMDCKNALVEANGDFEKAIEHLRKKGQKIAANREGREAKEGAVIARASADGKEGVVLSLNCETDFVAKNNEFVEFASKLVDLALQKKPASLNELKSLLLHDNGNVEQTITELTGKTGEKIELSRYEIIRSPKVVAYTHPGNRVATIVGFNTDKAENIDAVGKDLAMQIAAMSPMAIDKDDVPKDVIEKEIEIGRELAIKEGKPAEMAEKIAQGKLSKFFKESTLLNQEYIKDSKKTIRQFLKEAGGDLTVTSFKRFALNYT